MTTFAGHVLELENILIDNFLSYKSHTCFFLSHCHSDHMAGLDQLLLAFKDTFNQHLYCSPISRLILLKKYSYANENFIKELTSPKVITIPGNAVAPSYQVTVTPIPAGHCPGSIMFLFEAINTSILYTGDFRIYKGDIYKFKSLHSKHTVKSIDKLYFDSTFLNKAFWEFPLRSEVVTELTNLIRNWIKKGPKHNVLIETSALFGYEYVYVELGRTLKCRIHVKDFVYDLFWNVPEVGSFLTNDCQSTQVHAVGIFDTKCVPFGRENLLRIRLSAQWYKSSEGIKRDKIWKEISKGKILMCYSTHCSCSELVDILNYLKPKSLEPCCIAVGSTEESTKSYIKDLICSWVSKESPEILLKREFQLEKNYKFRLRFPAQKESTVEDLMGFSWDC